MIKHSDEIPDFITAQSPNGLRRNMYLNNAKHGCKFTYFDIAKINEEKKSYWIAWFLKEVTDIKELEDGNVISLQR